MQSELQGAIDAIHVRFGDQALVRAARLPAVEPWPTRAPAVDRLSGIGGLPRGRVSVLAGPPGSGKLSLGLALLAKASRDFAHAVVIDPGGGFDPWALEPLEPDLGALTVVRPPAETATGEVAAALARAGAGFLLILGPLPEPALAPMESAAARSGCAVVVVADEPAPRPLAYASSLTLGVRRREWIRERGLVVGLSARVMCVKNKLAAPGLAEGRRPAGGGEGSEAEIEIRYGLGGLAVGEAVREVGVLDAALDAGSVIEGGEPAWRVRSAAV